MIKEWQSYLTDLEAWRTEKEAQLREENGWLALAGLYWLDQGEYSLGSGSEMAIQLPAGSAPDYLATLRVAGDRYFLTAPAGAPIYIDGEQVTEAELRADRPGPATLVTSGSLAFFIKREDEILALRLWDNAREARQNFPGREWYPAHPDFIVAATFRPVEAQQATFPRTFGLEIDLAVAGEVTFALQGQSLSLQALPARDDRLFLIFRDQTSGQTTYGAGRYITTDPVVDGQVAIDFNRAYSPPCAFTNYATCRFPPASNHLPVAIEAGEKYVAWQD